MGKVGRPSNHIPVKFVEYKKEDGTVEVYILVKTRLIKLTPENLATLLPENNLPNPYEERNDEEKEKNEELPLLNAASTGHVGQNESNNVIEDIDNKLVTNPAEIPFEHDEYNNENLEYEALNDSYFKHDFQMHLFDDEDSNDEANSETTNDLTKKKSEPIPDLFEPNESYNPFQIYF